MFSELNVDLFLLGSGENEYKRLPEIAYATSELMVVVATAEKWKSNIYFKLNFDVAVPFMYVIILQLCGP